MNIIKTIADLKNALSAYDENKPVVVLVNGKVVTFNSEYQISQYNAEKVVISLSFQE
jgi:hypothetical protein